MIRLRHLALLFLTVLPANRLVASDRQLIYCGAFDDDGDPEYEYSLIDTGPTLKLSAYLERFDIPFLVNLRNLSDSPDSVMPLDLELPKSTCSISNADAPTINCTATSTAQQPLKVQFQHSNWPPLLSYRLEEVALASVTLSASGTFHNYQINLTAISQNGGRTTTDRNSLSFCHR